MEDYVFRTWLGQGLKRYPAIISTLIFVEFDPRNNFVEHDNVTAESTQSF